MHEHTLEPTSQDPAVQYFFPNVGVKDNKLHWYSPLSLKAHKRACQRCALQLGLPITLEDVDTYSSNCVRRGIAADTVEEVKQLLGQTNPGHGSREGILKPKAGF